MRLCSRSVLFVSIAGLTSAALLAQSNRLVGSIDNNRTAELTGHVAAGARAQFDRGPVASSFPMTSLTLHLKPSAAQQVALEQLLARQQAPSSADFHKWLSPDQYADRFGVSQADVNRIDAWLESQGFQVGRVARSRTWIEFSGAAQQVETAFHTQIHQYLENGELHYANSANPSIPAALSEIVLGIRGLNNFRLKPLYKRRSIAPRDTTPDGEHQMAPDDFAVIYDVAPLYTANVNGTGQKLVVVGQTDIALSDISSFRSQFNLPAIDLEQILVPNQADPGTSDDDLPEADLDIEWSGAVARNAQIIFVKSPDVFTSLQEAVDQDYAPVITMSYGICEGGDLVDLPSERQMAQQANAEGITWLAAAGDNGAADCDNPEANIAQAGLAVDAPGSVPEVTSMGGTEFVEGNGSYWSSTNTANSASALSYIPEEVWNDTVEDGGLSAGGGGVSIYFARPTWQTGPGVPDDSFRHVPDLSIASSADHDGYFVYTGGSMNIYGGTSVAAPTMAGIVTLLNQYLVSSGAQKQAGLGNINPTLYRMAQNSSTAFHDVVLGNNVVPCVVDSPNCSSGSFGYSASAKYDQASGIGSPDAYNLIHQWSNNPAVAAAVVPSIDESPVFEHPASGSGFRWTFTITLTEEAGVAATLTGFTINGQSYDVATVFGTTQIPADGSISSTGLGLASVTVPGNVVFAFTGTDAKGNSWNQTLSVPFDGVNPELTVAGSSNAASGKQTYAPGMLLSVYGSALGEFVQEAGAVPLPDYLAGFEATVNGVSAPLYYVSPTQVNIQIPYETQPGEATLIVGNPYLNVNSTLKVVAAAPGIFMSDGFVSAPFSSAAQGQITTLFITGEGEVSPALATGDTPAGGTPVSLLPKPQLPVTLTVGGQTATIEFIGIPIGLVGVTQVNYQVPTSTPVGVQPVVVTVGGVASQSANLTVTK